MRRSLNFWVAVNPNNIVTACGTAVSSQDLRLEIQTRLKNINTETCHVKETSNLVKLIFAKSGFSTKNDSNKNKRAKYLSSGAFCDQRKNITYFELIIINIILNIYVAYLLM